MRSRRNRQRDKARWEFGFIKPPHPAEAIDTVYALGKALTNARTIRNLLAHDPVLLELYQTFEKTLGWAIFFAARLPDDPRWPELAKRAGWNMDRFASAAMVKLQGLMAGQEKAQP